MIALMRQSTARVCRTSFLGPFAVLALAALLIVVPSGQRPMAFTAAAHSEATRPAAAQNAATYHRRADAALQSFLQKYWNPSQHYLNETYPSSGHLTGY